MPGEVAEVESAPPGPKAGPEADSCPGVEAFYQTKIFPEEYVRTANLMYDTEANLPVNHALSIFPVETKDDFVKESFTFWFQGTVIDCFRFFDFSIRP